MGITFSCAGWKAYSMIPTRLEYIRNSQQVVVLSRAKENGE